MKKIIFGLLIVAGFAGGCKRDVVLPYKLLQPDTIAYHNIVPDSSVTSIRGYYFGTSIPIPSDSSASFNVDVDGDLIYDFGLGTSHSFQYVSTSNPGFNYSYSSGIGTSHTTDGISEMGNSGPYQNGANFIPVGIVIDSNMNYGKNVCLFANVPSMFYGYGPSVVDNYIGFKIHRNNKNYFGWMLVSIYYTRLSLKSWAINKTAGNSILAGQTQ